MSKIEIWDRPISHWHIKMFPTAVIGCSAYKPDARSIKAKLAIDKFNLIMAAASELPEFEHLPDTYQNEVIVLFIGFDSGASRTLLDSDFPAQSEARKMIQEILNRVVKATSGMTGLVELTDTI